MVTFLFLYDNLFVLYAGLRLLWQVILHLSGKGKKIRISKNSALVFSLPTFEISGFQSLGCHILKTSITILQILGRVCPYCLLYAGLLYTI